MKTVTAKLAKAREFATRSGVDSTPTLIVAGKYRVLGRQDTGWDGMLKTAEFLAGRERASAKPAAKKKADPAFLKVARRHPGG